MKTLIIFAHTFWEDSKVNRALLESIKDLENVKVIITLVQFIKMAR